MAQTIHLEPSQVPAQLKGAYLGAKFKAIVCERVRVPIDAGLWSGGSRDLFTFVRLSDGATIEAPGQKLFHEGRTAREYDLPPGVALVCHTTFQGRDLGLTYHLHPDDVAALQLNAPAPDLSREAQIMLRLAGEYVASYRRDAAKREGIGERMYAAIIEGLQAQGLLTARGAITPKGRNVLSALPRIAGL